MGSEAEGQQQRSERGSSESEDDIYFLPIFCSLR